MKDERVALLSVKKKDYPLAIYLFFFVWYQFVFILILSQPKNINLSWFIKHASLSIPIAYALTHFIIELKGYVMYSWEIIKENRELKKQGEREEKEAEIEKARAEGRIEGKREAYREMGSINPIEDKDSKDDDS